MAEWNLTKECPPENGGCLYIVTPSPESQYTQVYWYFKNRGEYDCEDGECITNPYTGEVIAEFPIWCDMEWNGDVYDDDLEYYLEPEPYAWMEFPKPSGYIEPEEAEEEFKNEIGNVETLFTV